MASKAAAHRPVKYPFSMVSLPICVIAPGVFRQCGA